MTQFEAHSAKKSRLTGVWHIVQPIVPNSIQSRIRRVGQIVHTVHLSQEDQLLLSYPKSGSTWLRTMLTYILSRGDAQADQLAAWIPPLHLASKPREYTPRIVRSHDHLGTPGFNRVRRKLVLVRDPRALVVSYASHQKRRGRPASIEGCSNLLLNGGFDSLGSWQLHANQILKLKPTEQLLVVSYEQLSIDTHQTLKKIADFFELVASDSLLDEAIQYSRPDQMRKQRILAGLERAGENNSDVRKAKVDSWRAECPQDVQNTILEKAGAQMEALGYGD